MPFITSNDLCAAGAKLGLEEAGARPEWLPAGRTVHQAAVENPGRPPEASPIITYPLLV
jgi:hypothetical protein